MFQNHYFFILLLCFLILPIQISSKIKLEKQTKSSHSLSSTPRKTLQMKDNFQTIQIKFETLENHQDLHKTLNQMRHRVINFNNLVNTDRFMEHLAQPGTFLELGGNFPSIKIRSRMCNSPFTGIHIRVLMYICRKFKNRHLFWKKISMTKKTKRKLVSVESFQKSKLFLERKLLEIKVDSDDNNSKKSLSKKSAQISKKKNAKRVLSELNSQRFHQLKLIRNFVRPKKVGRKLPVSEPADHAINFDDSRLVVHMFAKMPKRQANYIRPENDKENVVIQPRIHLHQ